VNARNGKIVLTGAAGLVGQNLLVELGSQGYERLVAIDKHAYNLDILRELHPNVEVIQSDLAEPGDWESALAGAQVVVQLHAQITGKQHAEFERNNVQATRRVLDACERHAVPYLVHISSSVVNSVADDSYTRTKRDQEALVRV
jgi:nucleoside-diphosphate-sugar epimerase